MFKPHRGSSSHPAYSPKGVMHHSKMDHHPGKTHEHPPNPGMSEATPTMGQEPPPAPPGGGADMASVMGGGPPDTSGQPGQGY